MNDQTYFLANAAHELQTLLSLLCSSIQAIEAAHPEVRCYRYWPELSSDCRLMNKLLRDLTDYSMSDQLTKQRSDLCNLLRRAYLSCLPLTEGTNKTLTYTSRVSCAYMPLDSPKMMEALLNLIVNALDAVSDNGSVPVAKRIIEGHGGHIRVSSAPNQGATFTFLLPCSFSSDKK